MKVVSAIGPRSVCTLSTTAESPLAPEYAGKCVLAAVHLEVDVPFARNRRLADVIRIDHDPSILDLGRDRARDVGARRP